MKIKLADDHGFGILTPEMSAIIDREVQTLTEFLFWTHDFPEPVVIRAFDTDTIYIDHPWAY
jgi:hypothetical protein